MNPETYIFGQRHWKFEVETHDFLDKYILIGEMNNDNYIGCKRPDKNHLKVCHFHIADIFLIVRSGAYYYNLQH